MKRRWVWLTTLLLSLILIMASGWMLTSRRASTTAPKTWMARPVTALPANIATDDKRWNQAEPLTLSLHTGSHGPRTTKSVELRAIYDESAIAFRARWPGAAKIQTNEHFALVWHKDDLPDQRGQDCTVACHVARSSNQGDIQLVAPSFIPAGREEPLPAQAIWQDGVWTLTWKRPLRSLEARDVQFVDLSQRYRVRAKVFLDLNLKPDLLTEDTYLTFVRNSK